MENIIKTLTANNSEVMNGEFTVVNKLTGKHETFRVQTMKEGNFKGQRIVSHMETSVNYADYKWFGRVIDGKIKVFDKLKANKPDGKKSDYVCFGALLEDLFGKGELFSHKYDLQGSVNCSRCDRLLTNPSSLSIYLGSECAKKLGIIKPRVKRLKKAA